MATLHVRNVPDDLYRQLPEEAETDKRSLGAHVVVLLQKAVHVLRHQRSQRELLEQLRSNRITLPEGTPDSTTLLREDRSR